MAFFNPDDVLLEHLLRRTKTIALVGASPEPWRPAYQVMRYLLSVGYRVFPVRPGVDEVHGQKAFASLADLPEPPDLVDVFRALRYVPEVVEEAIACRTRALWLQDGLVHEAAAWRAKEAGLTVVMDACTAREHARLVARRG